MPPARSASSPVKPLLPVASPPTSPGVGRLPLHQHPVRRRARRVMLLGLLAFVAVNAAWGSRALFRAWQHAGSSRPESLVAGQPQQAGPAAAAAADGSAAGAQAASVADNAVEAALDAGAALRDAAGVIKHTAVAAGQAAGAAASLAAPVAVKAAAAVGNATSKAASGLAGAVSNTVAKTSGAVGGAAGAAVDKAAGTASKAAGSAGSAAKAAVAATFVWEERPGGAYPPAELPPPVVETTSNDSCAQALGAPKVALLFLTMGPMHHEATWRLWLSSAAGMLPVREAQAAVCTASPQQYSALRQACTAGERPTVAAAAAAAALEGVATGSIGSEGVVGEKAAAAKAWPIDQQHLFSVYLHAPPSFKGYPTDSLWHGHLIPRRTQTAWGDPSLIEATHNLLWEAYRDPLNQRFVLVSESDIPLYDPLTLYQQTEHMNAGHWRKSSQFLGLTRAHVAAVLNDTEVYRSFERHCWYAWSARRNGFRDCIPDEHYFATLLAVLGHEGETACGGWGVAAQDWSKGGPHPKSFTSQEVTQSLVHRMRDPALCNGSATAYAGAQRLFVHASQALPTSRQVVLPFGGTVHEVLLPPMFNEGYPHWFPHRPDSEEAGIRLREEAGTMLQCLTSRAALEQQRALAAAGLNGVPVMVLPPFLSELHGSFADLAQQLQECVHWRRQSLAALNGNLTVVTIAAGLAGSANYQSAADRYILWERRDEIAHEFNVTVTEFLDAVSALRQVLHFHTLGSANGTGAFFPQGVRGRINRPNPLQVQLLCNTLAGLW
ncbi:beta-1,6-N-acetylglucosaminyltransferase enzyme [Chlorella sorokiniana]|uniref:Beta-1,6-N-acetylglucosaminyltransferase enzyme n=1 Tax=Chlorella sorokiniana TaxID=3076 RepID=A0A2P6TBK9_CHLSO|nr:beta-1,6-N-acetylglucosaminyltransferase enzyme [Chlorella sorokiniana]|eukprot:PRW05940.1 beta-1,6-N-acetylglucosaminyltransferase enzyme [Chlorella sorokiniana]